jgi:thiamine-phosphate diphosphorylase
MPSQFAGHVARPFICVVTDRRRLAPAARTTEDEVFALEALLDDAMAENASAVQIREPDLGAAELVGLVRRVMQRRGAGGTLLLINDRADVAVACGADGVHLRAASPDPDRVRSLLAAGAIIGRSVHATAELQLAAAADYVLFGTVFPTASKPDGHPVAGIAALSSVASASAVPVIAIGGIDTSARAAECLRAGAAGVAGISIFLPEGTAPGALGTRRAIRELHAVALAN